jgi:hypothetical protein
MLYSLHTSHMKMLRVGLRQVRRGNVIELCCTSCTKPYPTIGLGGDIRISTVIYTPNSGNFVKCNILSYMEMRIRLSSARSTYTVMRDL